jgi:YVTN family beta-propeller protein
MHAQHLWIVGLLAVPVALVGVTFAERPDHDERESRHSASRFPSASGPIQITSNDRYVWVANPDANSVTVIDVGDDENENLAEVRVGQQPQNVAISPDDRTVYVSNTGSGTVSVLRGDSHHPRVIQTIRVGTEPYGMALTPNGSRLYVANARSNDVSVIDTRLGKVVETIRDVGLEPRGITITNDRDADDRDETVYVTRFLGVDRPGVVIGADDYKEARVSVISTRDNEVKGQITLNPISDTGFKAAGDALAHVPPGAAFTFTTAASPNMLNAIVIKGDHAYVPNTAASANGPVRFNVNVQALLSVIDLHTNTESQSQTINMNRGINFEPTGPGKIFIGVPWAAAFEHHSNQGWVVAAAANLLVKVDLDASGTPTIHAPQAAGDPGAIVRVFVGQNPRGLVINGNDSRAYVMNEVSRDVSVVDLHTHQVIAIVPSSPLPAANTDNARSLIGKAVFNSSTGVHLPAYGVDLGNRLSSEGWSGCFSCHPFGHTDGIVWIFATGPRRTLPLNGTFNPHDATDIKILNHSGIRDEVQDFELNIRAVSGGQGLITLADGVTPDPSVTNLGAPTTGRSELLDDLTFYVAHDVRTPISPLAAHRRTDADDEDDDEGDRPSGPIAHGRELFAASNCQSCHGGGGWSSGRRTFTPPPDPALISGGQIIGLLRNVGTFDPAAANEVRDNVAAPPLGAAGFVPPSLLGAHGFAPYLHNGSAQTFADVLDLVVHRSAGTGGVDLLTDVNDRRDLARFLASIDASTEPFPLLTVVDANGDVRPMSARQGPGTPTLRIESVSPNPTPSATHIAFSLPTEEAVSVDIYDLMGRRVATLASGVQAAGRHEVTWLGRDGSGSRVWGGVYFVRIGAGGHSERAVIAVTP